MTSSHDAASDLLVRCLEAEGVEYMFGLPGEENIWLVRSIQRSMRIRYVPVRHEQIGFTNPDFVRYAESFGARGVQIARTHDLLPALEAALAYDAVTVVACPVDYSENARLTDRLAALAPAS